MSKENITQIDFGTGKIAVVIDPDSNIVTHELIEALQSVAMTVPLDRIVNAIKGLQRF
jgi:hypothetical protein